MAKHRIEELADITAVAKAMADPHRVRALYALRGGELCQCQIVELVGLAPSTVSKHLTLLRQAGLVCAEKRGRWVYFTLPGGGPAHHALQWLFDAVAGLPEAARDEERLIKLKRIDPEELCRKQCRK